MSWTIEPAPSWPHLDAPYFFGGGGGEQQFGENPGKFWKLLQKFFDQFLEILGLLSTLNKLSVKFIQSSSESILSKFKKKISRKL